MRRRYSDLFPGRGSPFGSLQPTGREMIGRLDPAHLIASDAIG